MTRAHRGRRGERSAARVVLLAAGLAIAALLVWQLSHVLLLVFGAVLISVLLRAFGALIRRGLPLSDRAAVGLAALLIALALAGFFTLLGAQIRTQATELLASTPELVESVEERLGFPGLQEWLEGNIGELTTSGELASRLTTVSTTLLSVLGNGLLVIIGGLYLALSPRHYRDGLLSLVPEGRRAKAAEVYDDVGAALRLWLVGQLLAMLLVGVVTTTGLWLIGIPSALALGFIAALFEFVPFLGPVIAAVPAVALGLTEGTTTALWVAGLYLLVQQIEGYLITPLVQQEAVDLPPALTIFAIVAFGVLFGPLGVLLATPLTVVCFVLVKLLWVRDALGEETEIPGEEEVHG